MFRVSLHSDWFLDIKAGDIHPYKTIIFCEIAHCITSILCPQVLIARQCHFDYTTPDRERQDTVDVLTPRTNR